MKSTLKRLKAKKADKGLTLIELLIVIVILGILSATIVFAVGGMTSKSAIASCQTDGQTSLTAVDAFAAQNPGVTLTTAALTGTTKGGPYLSALPSNGTHYVFSIGGTPAGLEVSFSGAAAVPFTSISQCSAAGGNAVASGTPLAVNPVAIPPVNASPLVSYSIDASTSFTGGTGVINYTITSGSLPAGLTLNSATGVISGMVPAGTAAGVATFTVTATDSVSSSANWITAITIA